MMGDETLESLVNAERQANPTRDEVDRAWKRLEGALRAGVRPMRIAATPLSLGTILLTAKGAAMLAVAATGGVLALSTWGHRVQTEAMSHAPAAPSTQLSSRHLPGPLFSGPVTFPEVSQPEAAAVSSRPLPPPRSSTRAVLPQRPSLTPELELLAQAKAELDRGQPAAARAWLRRHASEFPQSMLAAERDTLAVLVDCITTPGPHSRKQAEQLLERYPHSVHRDRVRRACAKVSESPGEPSAAARFPSAPPDNSSAPPPRAAFPEISRE